ncbi:MAG: hypothetical protein ACFFD5_16530 [Candidatus Thorarchaeota archaeon]
MLSSTEVSPEIMEKLRELFKTQNYKKVLKTFKSTIEELAYYKFPQSLCIMIGELTKENSEFFMTRIYPKLYMYIIEKWGLEKKWAKFIDDMNLYILKNYCLFEGEEILVQFPANVFPIRVGGYIYMTQYRMILNGTLIQTGGIIILPKLPIIIGLIGVSVKAGINSLRREIRDEIAGSLSKEISEFQTGEWGYTLPVYKAFNIRKSKKEISYFIKLEEKEIQFKIRALKELYKVKALKIPTLIYDMIEVLLHEYQ